MDLALNKLERLMNHKTQTTNKYCLYNSPIKNSAWLPDFLPEYRIAFVNVRFQKEKGNYWQTPTQ